MNTYCVKCKKDTKNINPKQLKYQKRTPGHKELLNLFNNLLNTILTEKTSQSESQEDENKNGNEKVESRNKKTENENENEDKNTLLEYIEDVDDKLFKKYSHGKDFNSFINEFHSTTNKKKKLKNEKKQMILFVITLTC